MQRKDIGKWASSRRMLMVILIAGISSNIFAMNPGGNSAANDRVGDQSALLEGDSSEAIFATSITDGGAEHGGESDQSTFPGPVSSSAKESPFFLPPAESDGNNWPLPSSNEVPHPSTNYQCIYDSNGQVRNIRTICPFIPEPYPYSPGHHSYPQRAIYSAFSCPFYTEQHGQLYSSYECITTDVTPYPPNLYTCADSCPEGFKLINTAGSGDLCPFSEFRHICAPGFELQPYMNATPASVVIPYGQKSGSTTIAWNMVAWQLGGTVTVSVNGEPESLWTSGSLNSESRVWPYIAAGTSTTFRLYRTGSTHVPVDSVTVTGTQGAGPPTLTATPNPVQIPYGQSSGLFAMAWAAPGYTNVDVWLKKNGSAPTLWGDAVVAPGSTAAIQGINLGDTYTITMYPAGSLSPLLKSLTVTTVASPNPSLTATPNPVVIPFGLTNGLFAMAWTAPGYTNVDVWLKKNGSAPTLWGDAVAAPGSTAAIHGINLGDTYTITMYPAGMLTPLLKSLTVTTASASNPTLTATPNPVVIPSGQTSGQFAMAWSAPGHTNVDVWLKKNGAAPTLWGDSIASPGSTGAIHGINVGDTYTITMYPAGALTPVLKTITVSTIAQP